MDNHNAALSQPVVSHPSRNTLPLDPNQRRPEQHDQAADRFSSGQGNAAYEYASSLLAADSLLELS